MTAIQHCKPTLRKKQYAFILLPVVLTLTILAAIAYLLSHEGAMNAGNVIREQQKDSALYIAQAGYHHALWKINRQNCTDYTDIPTTTIGKHSYLASYTDTSGTTLATGSPANITVVGTDVNGVSHTINRYREKVFHYPLTNVTLQLGSDPGKDAAIFTGFFADNNNYGNYKQRVSTVFFLNRHQLIQFDLSSIPADVNIISAKLELKQTQSISAGGNALIHVHRMTQDWIEGTKSGSGTADGATWDDFDGNTSWDGGSGGSYDATSIANTVITSDLIVRNWDITSLVQGWYKGLYPNEGVLLKGSGTVNVSFASKEEENTADRPKLIINYACECGKDCAPTSPPPPAKKIYWTDDIANKIQRSDEDGSNVETVISGQPKVRGLDIDTVNGKIYWTSEQSIRRANLDGSNIETIFSSGEEICFDVKLDVAAGKMYWTYDNDEEAIMRSNLDGSNVKEINSSTDDPLYFSLDVTAGFIYVTEYDDGDISRMKLDGSGTTKLVTGSNTAIGSAIDPINGKLYWTGGSANYWIKRADIDGGNEETIVTGLNAPQDIVYDADNDRIYWTEGSNLLIQRANADGSNVETIVSTGLSRPRGIILVNADDVIAPLPTSACNGNFLDEFNATNFSGSDGSLTWTTDWQEVGESDGADSGDIRVTDDQSKFQLRLQDNNNGGEGVMREADLSGASVVKLSLKYRRSGLDKSSDYVSVEISSSGTAGPWIERARFVGSTNDSNYQSWNYTLDASEISAKTAIRLRTSSNMGGSDRVYFDDIEIQCSP